METQHQQKNSQSAPLAQASASSAYGPSKRSIIIFGAAAIFLGALLVLAAGIIFSYHQLNARLAATNVKLSEQNSAFQDEILVLLSGDSSAPVPRTIQLSGGVPALGSANAPVTVVEYADYQCPFCEKFFQTSLQELKIKYIDTGVVRFVRQDFAFLGQESFDAAEAADCAGDQGKYWDYHDYLYNHQNGENKGQFSVEHLKQFAGDLKLDTVAFGGCLDKHTHLAEVQTETKQGKGYGVGNTPTFFVNGKMLVGAVPEFIIEKMIDAAVAK